eukprot:2340398-Ditylum_brightwellii.AAC.1
MDMVHAQELHDTAAVSNRRSLWKNRQIGAVVYPNFGMWMPKRCFVFIKKHLQLSSYDPSTAEKAADKMWKIRDAFVAIKKTMHWFMLR